MNADLALGQRIRITGDRSPTAAAILTGRTGVITEINAQHGMVAQLTVRLDDHGTYTFADADEVEPA